MFYFPVHYEFKHQNNQLYIYAYRTASPSYYIQIFLRPTTDISSPYCIQRYFSFVLLKHFSVPIHTDISPPYCVQKYYSVILHTNVSPSQYIQTFLCPTAYRDISPSYCIQRYFSVLLHTEIFLLPTVDISPSYFIQRY